MYAASLFRLNSQNCIRFHTIFSQEFVCALTTLYTARMADDIQDKLNALVGEALRGLVESGAAAESIGSFAATYREKASRILGISAAPPAEPDLRALVTDAVATALADAGFGAQKNSRAARPKAHRFIVHVSGKRTSVTISAATSEKLLAANQGRRGDVTALLETLANQAPSSEANRSKWVEQRALTTLNFDTRSDASAARH